MRLSFHPLSWSISPVISCLNLSRLLPGREHVVPMAVIGWPVDLYLRILCPVYPQPQQRRQAVLGQRGLQ
jgi:hypothetical protein